MRYTTLSIHCISNDQTCYVFSSMLQILPNIGTVHYLAT